MLQKKGGKSMRKKTALIIAALIALSSLSGCAGNGSDQNSNAVSAGTTVSDSVSANESSTVSETAGQESSSSDESSGDRTSSQAESSVKESKASESKSSAAQSSSEGSKEASKQESGNSSTVSTVSSVSDTSKENSKESVSSLPSEISKISQHSGPVEISQPSQVSREPEPSKPEASKPEPSQPEPEPVVPDKPSSDNDIGGMALYNELFKIENKVSVEISMDKSEIDKLQADYNKYTAKNENTKSSVYRMANLTVKVGSKSYTIDEVGIRMKGNQSLEPFYASDGTPNICSFKLSFDETFDDKDEYGSSAKVWTDDNARKARKKRTFATLNEMDIKWNICYDNTNIREIYATKLFESANVLVQKIGLSQLKINGNNYGLVKIYEPIDKNFLEKRLPESALDGDLYKCMWSECNNSGGRTGRWRGSTYKTDNCYGIQDNEKGIKFNFNLKTNKKTSKHESLKNFLNVINKSNLSKSELEKVLDVDYYASFMAASYFAGDPDDIRNNYNNHYLYFRKDNGKAIFIVYDNDRTMGITYGLNKNCATRNPYSSYAATQNAQENPLIKKTITHDTTSELMYIREKFTAALNKLSQTEMLTSDADFNKMYNTAKSNYESIITPYTRFANQEENFRFSLDGNKNGGDRSNMSFEQFRSQIMDTFRNAKP